MADILEGLGSVLAADVEEDFFAASVGRRGELVDCLRGKERGKGGSVRMLIDKLGDVVDFVVDD